MALPQNDMTHFFVKKAKTGQVIGPLSARQIKKFCFETRIKAHDEISTDRENWREVCLIPELYSEDTKTIKLNHKQQKRLTTGNYGREGYDFWKKRPRHAYGGNEQSNLTAGVAIVVLLVVIFVIYHTVIKENMNEQTTDLKNDSQRKTQIKKIKVNPKVAKTKPRAVEKKTSPASLVKKDDQVKELANNSIPTEPPLNSLQISKEPSVETKDLKIDKIGSDGLNDLSRAIYLGVYDDVSRLINEGADVNMKTGKLHYPPLIWAMHYKRRDSALLLLDHGANAIATDENKRTILHWAAQDGHRQLMQKAFQKKADLNAKDNQGRTPLHLALKHKQHELSGLLLDQGCAISQLDQQKNDELILALKAGNKNLARHFIREGLNPNNVNLSGESPLDLAIQNKFNDLTDLLIKNGAISSKEFFKLISKGDLEGLTSFLKKAPAFSRAKSKTGYLALQRALLCGNKHAIRPMVKLFIENGANINAPGISGDTSLHTAVSRLQSDIVQYFIKNGGDVNVKNSHGKTALHKLTGHKKEAAMEIARFLLDKGIDLNAKDKLGLTAIEECVNWNNGTLLEIFIEHGADVNALTISDVTLLDSSILNHKDDAQRILLRHEALTKEQLMDELNK